MHPTEQAVLPFSGTIQERFEAFDREHPEVYAYLVHLVRDLRSRGWNHYGVRALWERCRWHFQIERGLGDEFKLNDHFHSRYARKLMAEHPEFDGFFETRRLAS